MNMKIYRLVVRTKKTDETIDFSDVVTFIFGPVGTGKSTIARLVDYCLGGSLERTPAIQQEFISAELQISFGHYRCSIERAAGDSMSVRVSFNNNAGDIGSINIPIHSEGTAVYGDDVYCLSDLIFKFSGTTPIKVRKQSRDPDSPLIRLSFRDIWWYCYLEQTHLDSSFFNLDDPFKGRKSQDAMRFFTGLHSERLSQIESELMSLIDDQRTKRVSAEQIRTFMRQFGLESDLAVAERVAKTKDELAKSERRITELEQRRNIELHPTDTLRDTLRDLSEKIGRLNDAIVDSSDFIDQQKLLLGELIMAKVKTDRVGIASAVLNGVSFERCPQCGVNISARATPPDCCHLCGTTSALSSGIDTATEEASKRDINGRIDEINDSISRRKETLRKTKWSLEALTEQKRQLDEQLRQTLERYDSSYVEAIRLHERERSMLIERLESLKRLESMPTALNALQQEAGAMQGKIDVLRSELTLERKRLSAADAIINSIANEFKRIMIAVSFPGVSREDRVVIDPRNWKPVIHHGEYEWSFWDTGSGGKKTLFNVCYALALHSVAVDTNIPVPNILIIDSPTKNISDDENPEIVTALYAEIYRIVTRGPDRQLQLLLIDSDVVAPVEEFEGYSQRRMAGVADAPSLIPYYSGP